MLDFGHLPIAGGDIQIFTGRNHNNAEDWQTWRKPRGCSNIFIFLLANGGGGGDGATGATGSAAGGGGGGSGGQSILNISASLIPDIIYLNLLGGFLGGVAQSSLRNYVSIAPSTAANNQLIVANSGASGGTASGATPGTAGAAGGVASMATMPLAGMGNSTVIAGQAGVVGNIGTGGAITLPTTGLVVTGGSAGAGVTSNGANGGLFTVAGIFPPQPGGVGSGSATGSGGDGSNGHQPLRNLLYFYGGTGGASSGGTFTADIRGGNGGFGDYGCGGGGGGGCVTGGVAGVGGKGGDALCIIVAS